MLGATHTAESLKSHSKIKINIFIGKQEYVVAYANTKEQKIAFFRHIADELNRQLGVRREDVFISLVFVDREDRSFGNGEPW